VWTLGNHVVIPPHETVTERYEVAKRFVAKTGYTPKMYVDNINNLFMDTFWAHPERFYIIADGKLLWKAVPTDEGAYELKEITQFLDKYWSEKNAEKKVLQ